MPKHYPEPAGDYIIVVDIPHDTSIDGITMPENTKQQEMVYGTVIFVGPLVKSTDPEDQVCYGPYAGKLMVIEGTQFRILREGQIEFYLRQSE
jgi:co-chaperonin GroES (HSP10)